MPRKRFSVEQIISHLREAEDLLVQGQNRARPAPGFAATLAAFKGTADEGFGASDMTVLHKLFRDDRIIG